MRYAGMSEHQATYGRPHEPARVRQQSARAVSVRTRHGNRGKSARAIRSSRPALAGPPSTARSSRYSAPLEEALLWLFALTASIAMSSASLSDADLLLGVGVLSTALGLRGFYAHGGAVLTFPAVYSLGHAIMVGFSGIYLATVEYIPTSMVYLNLASILLFLQLLLMQLWFWRSWKDVPIQTIEPSHKLLLLSVFLNASGVVGLLLVDPGPGYSASLTYFAVEGLFAVGFLSMVLLAAHRLNRLPLALALTLSLLLIYTFVIHDGGGRLRIAALGVAMLAALSLRFRTHLIKLAIILALPLALLVLAWERVRYIESTQGTPSDSTGFESLITPLWSFSRVLHATSTQSFDLLWGLSFSTPVAPLLGNPFPNIEPFGYMVAHITKPWITNPEYSDAAHFSGEFLMNFGFLGLVLYPLAVGLLLRNSFVPLLSEDGFLGVLLLLLWCLLIGTALELQWSGFHAGVYRGLGRIYPLLPFLFLALVSKFRSGSENQSGKPNRRL